MTLETKLLALGSMDNRVFLSLSLTLIFDVLIHGFLTEGLTIFHQPLNGEVHDFRWLPGRCGRWARCGRCPDGRWDRYGRLVLSLVHFASFTATSCLHEIGSSALIPHSVRGVHSFTLNLGKVLGVSDDHTVCDGGDSGDKCECSHLF